MDCVGNWAEICNSIRLHHQIDKAFNHFQCAGSVRSRYKSSNILHVHQVHIDTNLPMRFTLARTLLAGTPRAKAA